VSTLTIQLPDELKERLTAEARRLRKRPAQLVQETLEARLQNGSQPSRQSIHDLSGDLCGSVTGGPHDLARNKRHLKGYGSWKR
jgi:hypothetical protein